MLLSAPHCPTHILCGNNTLSSYKNTEFRLKKKFLLCHSKLACLKRIYRKSHADRSASTVFCWLYTVPAVIAAAHSNVMLLRPSNRGFAADVDLGEVLSGYCILYLIGSALHSSVMEKIALNDL